MPECIFEPELHVCSSLVTLATTYFSTDESTVQITDHYFSVLQERTHTKKSHKKSEQNKKSPKERAKSSLAKLAADKT
jgi:hypothetical protein